jgi:hypothetical protein
LFTIQRRRRRRRRRRRTKKKNGEIFIDFLVSAPSDGEEK